jgi:atlastin
MDVGHPVQIVVLKPNQTYDLLEEELEKILCQPEVQDKHVVVVSVAGAFRKGKSFILSFFVRYLQSQVGFRFWAFSSENEYHCTVAKV